MCIVVGCGGQPSDTYPRNLPRNYYICVFFQKCDQVNIISRQNGRSPLSLVDNCFVGARPQYFFADSQWQRPLEDEAYKTTNKKQKRKGGREEGRSWSDCVMIIPKQSHYLIVILLPDHR
jgi:hypothetical protein